MELVSVEFLGIRETRSGPYRFYREENTDCADCFRTLYKATNLKRTKLVAGMFEHERSLLSFLNAITPEDRPWCGYWDKASEAYVQRTYK